MGDWSALGKILVYFGLGMTVIGLVLWGIGRVFSIGRLPGDILIQKEGLTVYFPLATCLLLSLILTLLFNVLRR